MKSIDALKRLSQLPAPAFTSNDAAAALRVNRPRAAKILERLGAAGHLLRLRRGLWTMTDRHDLARLAAQLVAPAPAYLSLQSALHAHGLITQIPQRLYLVSTARTRLYRTPLGSVSVHHVKPSFCTGFFVPPRTGVPLAVPEKSLVDFLYLTPARSRLFGVLPEIEWPRGFRWRTAHRFVQLITAPRRRAMVAARLRDLQRQARSG